MNDERVSPFTVAFDPAKKQRPVQGPYPQEFYPGCPCWTCDSPHWKNPKIHERMCLCPTCGNKRCPGAVDHTRTCSHSNDTGQRGSFYEGV